MTSTTSYRDFLGEWWSLYRWNLRRSRGMILLYLMLLILAGPVMVMALSNGNIYVHQLAETCSIISMPFTMIFVLVFSIQRFGYMHNKRSVDLYHSMPVRRVPMLLGAWSAALTGIVVPILLEMIFIVLAGNYTWKESFPPDYNGFASFAGQMGMAAVCLSFCMLMAVCSGSIMDMVVSILLTNFFYPAVVLLAMVLGSWILPGFSGFESLMLFTAFAPFPAMAVQHIVSHPRWYIGLVPVLDSPVTFWIWWGILLVVMLVAGLWLYARRKSESAENELAFPAPKIILRFLSAAGLGMMAGTIFYLFNGNESSLFIGFFIFSFIAHVVTESLYSRGLKKFFRTLPAYGAMALCMVLLYLSAATGFFGYDTRLPVDAQSVTLNELFYNCSEEEYSLLAINNKTTLYCENEKIASRTDMTFREPESIQAVEEFQTQLVAMRKADGQPFYPICNTNWRVNFEYQTPSGPFERSISIPNNIGTKGKQEWEKLISLEEWKQQTLPGYLDPNGISDISLHGLIDEESGEEISISNMSVSAEESKKLLELIEKESEKLGFWKNFKRNSSRNICFLDLDVSKSFTLTEDSPWYDLAPEYKGKVVKQSLDSEEVADVMINDQMTETINYLLELAKSKGINPIVKNEEP